MIITRPPNYHHGPFNLFSGVALIQEAFTTAATPQVQQ
jgi:hypothetical protein